MAQTFANQMATGPLEEKQGPAPREVMPQWERSAHSDKTQIKLGR